MAAVVHNTPHTDPRLRTAHEPEPREKDRIKSVFVVDDNESQLATLAALLEDEGLTVQTSNEPNDAIARIASGSFGVAVVDLKMPNLSGIQVLDAIKRQARTTHVIIHTAHGDFDSARQAVNLGAFAFVEKLGDPGELLAYVHRACNDLLDRYNDELEAKTIAQSAQLYLSEQRALTTLDSIAEGVITTDANANIDYMNPVAESLTGWTLDNARGKAVTDVFRIIDGATRKALADPAARCLELGRPISASRETILLHHEAQEFWINGSAAPLRDANGAVVGSVIAVNDVTARVKAERELRRHQDHLEDLVSERTAALRASLKELESFSYSVSHDLRSPLRSIDGFSKILLEDYNDVLDANGKDSLRRVRLASQHMGRLIDDLLKLSRLTRRDMSRERVDISALAHEIANRHREQHPERRIDFAIDESLMALGDPNLLQVALDNLIGNAVKYTSMEAAAEITVRGSKCEERAGEWVFCITDNGVGFDMRYSGKLFGAFQRLHNLDAFEGTGIGLATTARVIERHGGRIWAESALDEGAKFYFTLPGIENS
ncbi:MAG: response regulator [Gammaproteobacteria bacterium]|nr:response regulator [Gammaproteobacteria bacterium]